MSVRVMGWVWDNSQSKGTDRLVLLAIADCASDDGSNAYPSMATLVRKTGLGERTIQDSFRRLKALGELKVMTNAGPKGCNRYRVLMDSDPRRSRTPADPAPPQIPHPAKSAGGAVAAPQPPQQPHPTPAAAAPRTVLEPSVEPSVSKELAALPPGARPTQRSKAITDAYHSVEPMSKWPAVNAIVLKAINIGRWSDDEIRSALLRLADDGRAVTIDTLRIELTGPPLGRTVVQLKPSTTDQRVAQALAVGAEVQMMLEGRSA